ncbi:tryptophan halogenase family protein [Candidatus Phycosocius spiralis]|uniref:Tryptophan halogenase n=1 Tax=Candidatus Phycosocius spiralis TaxID=2815099 RepID=A0ABQ4PVR0_9PROT|nr:tryptophan halogenase family protein [Candidatus Phycosocius spiralis]GIU67062.1 tryptophan halogenase [Candidatus Phycosocius spiralis]
MSAAPIRRIVILGGGTAGWSAAAAMAKFGENQAQHLRKFDITVVDSSQIGTIGVGEASVPNIANFNAWLGLDELDFIVSTGGTFKLGIEFVDWRLAGTKFFHPFGRYGVDLKEADFHQCLAQARNAGFNASLESFSLPITLARQCRFSQPVKDARSPLSDFGYAYHFDAGLYAKRLRRYALDRDVKQLDRKVVGAALTEKGHIDALVFDNGARLEEDLFIDCSGFNGILIEGALNTGYDDWSHWLACDRAVAMGCLHANKNLEPYTQATACEAGWTWRIPLQHRVGNGYVYCSAFLEDQAALDRLTSSMELNALAEPNFVRFVSGNRKRFWNKNCVALGLAGGFIEPLESTSINLVHRALSTLMEYFPDTDFDPRLQAVANRRMRLETENIRDFIILHYKASQRRDTPFWCHCADMEIPDSLALKMDTYRAAGHLLQFEAESFKPESWLTLFDGLGLIQETVEPFARQLDAFELMGPLKAMQASIAQAAQQAMPHAAFIERFCPLPVQ